MNLTTVFEAMGLLYLTLNIFEARPRPSSGDFQLHEVRTVIDEWPERLFRCYVLTKSNLYLNYNMYDTFFGCKFCVKICASKLEAAKIVKVSLVTGIRGLWLCFAN